MSIALGGARGRRRRRTGAPRPAAEANGRLDYRRFFWQNFWIVYVGRSATFY